MTSLYVMETWGVNDIVNASAIPETPWTLSQAKHGVSVRKWFISEYQIIIFHSFDPLWWLTHGYWCSNRYVHACPYKSRKWWTETNISSTQHQWWPHWLFRSQWSISGFWCRQYTNKSCQERRWVIINLIG